MNADLTITTLPTPIHETFSNTFMGMFESVIHQNHGSLVLVFLIGIIFGGIIQYTRVDKFEKIAGFAMLKDMTVPKMLFMAVGITSIGLYFMIDAGLAHYHVKPIMLQGLVIGGILFGASMAIFGKCPGTGPISLAEGRIDVLIGAIGGLLGGLVYTLYYDTFFKSLMGDDKGKMILLDLFPAHSQMLVLIFGIVLIAISIIIPNMELIDETEEQHFAQERP